MYIFLKQKVVFTVYHKENTWHYYARENKNINPRKYINTVEEHQRKCLIYLVIPKHMVYLNKYRHIALRKIKKPDTNSSQKRLTK